MIEEYVGQPITPGLYAMVPHEVYHSDPCPTPSLSASIAKRLVVESPLHAWSYHPRLGGMHSVSSDATSEGSLIDNLILGGGPEIVPINAKDYKTKEAQLARDYAFSQGQMPVIASHLAAARERAEQVKERLHQRNGFKFDGFSQITVFWKMGDEWCRGRFDHWKPKLATVYDFKWVRSSSPEDVEKHMITYGTDVQGAAYVSAIETIYPELTGRVKFQPIFVENGPVLAINMRPIGATMRELGRRSWQRGVELWTHCRTNDFWPDYGDNGSLEAPKYAVERELNRAVQGLPVGGSKDVPF